MTNSLVNGLVYRSQRNGTYKLDFYLRIEFSIANSSEIQAVMMLNGVPYRELDYKQLSNTLMFSLQGGSSIGLKVGDEIVIIGKTTGIKKSIIKKIEIKKKSIQKAKKSDEVGIALPKVRKNDDVYVIIKN